MLPGMASKARIAIIGAGKLGSALAVSLRKAGYTIDVLITWSRESLPGARKLAKKVGARSGTDPREIKGECIWLCVPDSEISAVARAFPRQLSWKGRVALHSSGALTSDALDSLRRRGASVASVHPLMTFVRGSRPSLAGVPFAIEGDSAAVRMARRMVRDLGGSAYSIRRQDKAAYHAWGMFASPLLTALLATTERVAMIAGVSGKAAKKRMMPILQQTLANYAAFGAPDAFSGPIIRGDVETIRRHLSVLKREPLAREVYTALARAALSYLPTKNRDKLKRLLASGR